MTPAIEENGNDLWLGVVVGYLYATRRASLALLSLLSHLNTISARGPPATNAHTHQHEQK